MPFYENGEVRGSRRLRVHVGRRAAQQYLAAGFASPAQENCLYGVRVRAIQPRAGNVRHQICAQLGKFVYRV